MVNDQADAKVDSPASAKLEKVFCIGLNKTGTTSFGQAMRELGYNVWGWNSHSERFTIRWHQGEFTDPMKRAIQEHDAFEDLPWPMLFKQLDALYPHARFVLTTRSSPEVWLESIQKHIKRGGPWVGHFLIYGSYDPVADKRMYLRKYLEHNDAVREHFMDRPSKLLEMCFEDGDGWGRLCPFLGIDRRPQLPFPHANKAN